MTAKSTRAWVFWILSALIAGVFWWVVGLYRTIHPHQPKGEVHTTQVLSYSGSLDSSNSVAHVTVYKVEKFSTGPDDMQSIFQNRIELVDQRGRAEFMWPSDTGGIAGSGAAVLDLVGDRSKEILIYDGGQDIRVVAYLDGGFRFRSNLDVLGNCTPYGVGPVELKGHYVFICGVPYPGREADPTIYVPKLLRWSVSEGFYDVSAEYPNYYKTKLIPELRGRMAEERDPGRRDLYKSAIHQLSERIGLIR